MHENKNRDRFLMLRKLVADSAHDLGHSSQNGFIPMLIIFLLVIAAVIYLAFKQVIQKQN